MVTAACIRTQLNPICIFYIVLLLSKNMVVGMVNPNSPTETEVRASTLQQSEVVSDLRFSPRSYVRRPNAPACIMTPESE